MRGRKSLPDAVKIMRGTDQPCRMSGDDGITKITDVNQIKSVAGLKLLPTKRAKAIFKQKANQLIGLRVLTILDIEQLAVYANSLDVLFDCLDGMRRPAIKKIDKDGNLVGYVTPPEVALYSKMVEHVNRIGSEYGFTPVSRQRIKQDGGEEENEIEEVFNNIK